MLDLQKTRRGGGNLGAFGVGKPKGIRNLEGEGKTTVFNGRDMSCLYTMNGKKREGGKSYDLVIAVEGGIGTRL